MKKLSIREMRESIGKLDALVEDAGELVITRRGVAIARVLPARTRRRPDHADLRDAMKPLKTPSEVLVREDRDER